MTEQTKNDYFVPVFFHEQWITAERFGVDASGEYGHAAWIHIDGETGATKYYEYGRYNNSSGQLKNVTIPNVTIPSSGDPDISAILQNLSTQTGESDVSATIYSIDPNGYQELETFYSGLVNDPNSALGQWTPWNSCYGVMVEAASRVGVNLDSIDGFGTLYPATAAKNIIQSNGGIEYDADHPVGQRIVI